MQKTANRIFVSFLFFLFFTIPTSAQFEFETYTIVDGEVAHWWARNHADVNGDGLLDFFVINENATGGWLGWYETVEGFGPSIKHIIAETGPDGGTFACGDLASGDIDGDGDIDVLGPVSPGEWGGSTEPTEMYWYENPSWEAHYIGSFPNFIKDVDLVDMNGDGKLDLAGTCFDFHRMLVYRQDAPDKWVKAADIYVQNLHEGQDVGDVDGDGDIDVISTAFLFTNPGGDMTDAWKVTNIDPYWNSDNGSSWQYNATKIFCEDIDADGQDEVFISCSERFRNGILWYDYTGDTKEPWKRNYVGLNSLSHTLQVGDIDGDGDFEVLSGNNGHQETDVPSPVIIFHKEPDAEWWSKQVLTLDGAYNSYLADVDGDGDLDFFRYNGHEGDSYELWLNKAK